MLVFDQRESQYIQFGSGDLCFVPKIGGVAAGGIGLADDADDGLCLCAQLIEFVEIETALHFDVIDLLDVRPRFEHGVRERAIVSQKDESAGGVIEIAYRIDAFRKTTQEIAESLAARGICEGGDDLGGLVQDQVDRLSDFFDEAASSLNLVDSWIGLGAEFTDDVAVDQNLAGENELFGVAARSDSGMRDDFL